MKVNLYDLENLPDKRIEVYFNEEIDELKNNKPVLGQITVYTTYYGAKVSGHVQTEITLECDRCLDKFNSNIEVDIDEKYVKDSLAFQDGKEFEIKEENFVEELNGSDEIDITDLIYQSIILNIPSKKLCDIKCPGSLEFQKLKENKEIDPRLEIFKKLSDENKE